MVTNRSKISHHALPDIRDVSYVLNHSLIPYSLLPTYGNKCSGLYSELNRKIYRTLSDTTLGTSNYAVAQLKRTTLMSSHTIIVHLLLLFVKLEAFDYCLVIFIFVFCFLFKHIFTLFSRLFSNSKLQCNLLECLIICCSFYTFFFQ